MNERKTKDLLHFIWPQIELLQSSQFKSSPSSPQGHVAPSQTHNLGPRTEFFFALRCSQPDRVAWAVIRLPQWGPFTLIIPPWASCHSLGPKSTDPGRMTQRRKWKVSKSQWPQSARLPGWKAAQATSHPVLSKWSWSETSLLPTPPPAHPQAAAWQV